MKTIENISQLETSSTKESESRIDLSPKTFLGRARRTILSKARLAVMASMTLFNVDQSLSQSKDVDVKTNKEAKYHLSGGLGMWNKDGSLNWKSLIFPAHVDVEKDSLKHETITVEA